MYRITAAGVALADGLVREYLREPVAEYPVFVAALAHILNLGAADAVELLRERCELVQRTHDDIAAQVAELPAGHRVVLLEVEYVQAMRAAELTWLRGVTGDIENGELPWLDGTTGDGAD